MKQQKQFTLKALTEGLDVTVQGDVNCVISGVATIQQAQPGHVTFVTNHLYRKHLETTQASAIIVGVTEPQPLGSDKNLIISSNPYYTYARIACFFADEPIWHAGIHASALVGDQAEIDATASIAGNCVIGQRVKIGAGVMIGAGCAIGDDVVIGAGSIIDANVTIYYGVKIGKRVRISSGVVLGSDGFGFANDKGMWHSVPQLGSVQIGDDVSIGANTTIDRGAIVDTVIENGVKLDNLIQVGHNVRIGANSILAGCTAIAGSVTIGKNCMIGGASCFNGHITVCDNAVVTGMTAVTKSITEPGIYSSGIVGAVTNLEFRKNNARFHRLQNLMDRVKALELALDQKTERK